MTKKFPNRPPQAFSNHEDRPYRPGVGIVLFNRKGEVFIGERIDNPDKWQMPQGGIDEGEAPEIAVFREMEEEIGTRNAKIVGMMSDWLFYDIPLHTANKLWDAKYRGQKQKWIALEFLGDDSEINLEAHHHPEFSQWKWVPLSHLLDYIVSFKREMYATVIEEFKYIAIELADNYDGE